jgi:2-polyprenyl-6-methoxyphenol hydroxylase-like FAD-dependent oxidoreductase
VHFYEAHDRMNGNVIHNAEDVTPHDLNSGAPYVTYRGGDRIVCFDCDYVIGADGFDGVSRKSIPKGFLREYERTYPFGWLGVLSRTKPVSPELIYAKHERGFALCSLRSQVLGRYYIQVPLTDATEDWSDDAFWSELKRRRPEEMAAGADDGPVDREKHRAVAQLRGRADALWPAIPRRRRRTHRAAALGGSTALHQTSTTSITPWSITTKRATMQVSTAIQRRHWRGSGRRSASHGG